MAITSRKHQTNIEVKHEGQIGWLVVDHIRTIDKERFIKVLGRLSKLESKEYKSVLKRLLQIDFNEKTMGKLLKILI